MTDKITADPQAPTVNINGTSGGDLLDQYVHARDAVRAALARVIEAAPHARDYQTPIGRVEFNLATAEHNRRARLLTEIAEELDTIATAVFDQLLNARPTARPTIISMTPGKADAEATARKLAARSGKPYGVWEHVGLYGRPEGDVRATHQFKVLPLDKPDPPDEWALVTCIDP